MTVVQPGAASRGEEHIWFNGALVTIRVSTTDTASAFSLAEVLARVGHATPLHVDPGWETFQLLEGDMLFHVAGNEIPAAAGDTVILPAGVPHAFLVTSPLVRYIVLNVPGGHDRFFRLGGDPAVRPELPPPAAPDLARVGAAAAAAGLKVLGPPPFSKAP